MSRGGGGIILALFIYLSLVHMCFILCVYMFVLRGYLCTMCVPGALGGEMRPGSPGTRVKNKCGFPCGYMGTRAPKH